MNKYTVWTDEKLKDFVSLYEVCPIARQIYDINDYKYARYECYFRFKDDSIDRVDFFEKNPYATLQDYENYKNN